MSSDAQVVVNGWTIYTHPVLLDALEADMAEVERLAEKDPIGYEQKNVTKRFAAVLELIADEIPQDPASPKYLQGNTLGSDHRHWRRAKFFGQYRLFFQFRQQEKAIIFGWVNDNKTLRAYGSKNDAYRVFQKRLRQGNPPNDWDELLAEARDSSKRFEEIISRII